MIRFCRLALAPVVTLSLLAAAPAAPRAQDHAPPLPQRDRVWAQSFAGITPDPAIRFGVLANGMRYAVMRNTTPSKQASLRLRIGSGSLEETDAQQGLAHFLEHMAFNGSKRVPQGEMIRILERHGLAFGADTNASTDWTATVYQLDLPTTDPDTLDTGLMLMRETASELTLAQSAMDTERGVVLSEERARDTPGYRVFKARLAFLLKNQLAARRLPIGSVEVLKTAAAPLIRAYYQAWYRPERATLIAVGDFDPDAMEAKIKAQFSDWKAASPPLPEPDLGKVAKRGLEAQVVVDPGAQTAVEVGWAQPPDLSADSPAKRRRDTIDAVALAVLNRRLERLARSDTPPFIGAAAGQDDYFRSAKVTTLTVNTDPDHWREGLVAAEEARRRALQFGVRQDEVDRELTEFRTTLQDAAAGQATRRTPSVANELVQSVEADEVFTSPQEDLALFQGAVAGLTAAQVTDALKRIFEGDGPLVFLSSPKPVPGGEAAVLAAYRQAETAKLAAVTANEVKSWPYQTFGPPGTVAETRQALDVDATFVRFANGVRLTVKPTKFRQEQVLVSVRIGQGRLEVPRDRPLPFGLGSAFIEGGLKDIDAQDLEQVLASKIYTADFGVGDDAFVLSGATRPQDVDTELQVLAAYVAYPGWRPQGFLRMKTYGATLLRQMEATSQGVLRRDLGALLHAGDPRWSFPTQAQIEAGKPEDVRALLEGPLAKDPIEVVVVGDISVDQAIKSVAATFGALPPRGDAAKPDPTQAQVRFPAASASPVERTHGGRADQAIGYLAWRTTDFYAEPQKQRALRLLELVLERRLIDQVRIAEGSTYSPSADWEASLVLPGYGYVSADVEIPPEKIPGFYATVDKIVADLKAKEVGADELERARKPRIEAIEKAQQTNEYWLNQLSGAALDPRRLEIIRAAVSGLQRVTAADVRAAAQEFLTADRAWKLVVKAKGAP